MVADLVLGLDQGTTGSTVLVVDRDLKVQGRGYATFPSIFPSPGGWSTIHRSSWIRS